MATVEAVKVAIKCDSRGALGCKRSSSGCIVFHTRPSRNDDGSVFVITCQSRGVFCKGRGE